MEPLAVTPKAAFAALGIGATKGYELINAGRLKVIKIGRATRVTVPSIKEVAANGAPAEEAA